MSDIEEDIKRCEKLTKPQNANWIGISNQMAIAGALARIKELEEEKKKYIVQLTDKEYRNLVDTIRKEAKQEFEQKVKDKIEEYFEDEEWLIEHDLRALCDDEKECREYYINKKIALKDIKKNILDKLNKLLNNY